MLAKVRTCAIVGLEGAIVEVEVDISPGLPSFTRDVLPIYGRRLYEAMFAPNAPHATTHILTRDYARRTIEIAWIHHPDALTAEERKRVTPPFTDGGIREWGQSEDKNKGEYRAGNAPIQMDFENYTIGRLIQNRRNYDSEHMEYKTAVANIFWRIYDLGYSLEMFGEIDKDIARGHWTREESRGKTDRYGKKYSWIAFYELAGFRQDQGLLDDWYGHPRIGDADIDPSFPQPVQELQVVDRDLLGDRGTPLHEWIEKGNNPDVAPYMVFENLCNEKGPWVLLDGFICQEDVEAKRLMKTSGFPRYLTENLGYAISQKIQGAFWIPKPFGFLARLFGFGIGRRH
jgi:hypothetical protein